jgi:hypothetical protein
MKLLHRDIIKLSVIFIFWSLALNYCNTNNYSRAYDALKYFPFHLIVTLGYYAILSICYNVLFIRDCQTEHKELLDDLRDARDFFNTNKIKFN